MKYKPRATPMTENMGYFTLSCKSKELALKLINEWLKEEEGGGVATIEEIKEDEMYRCADCEFFTIGDSMCCECGEQLNSRPRKTFVYYSDPEFSPIKQ